jgi:predicted nucleic acid-binding protein
VIVDASVVIKWFFAEPGHEAARELLAAPEPLAAPDLLLVEVADALRRKVAVGEVPASTASRIVAAIGDGSVIRLERTARLVPRALEIALSLGHPLPDCVSVALASERGVPLLTADERLARVVRFGGIAVEVRTLR